MASKYKRRKKEKLKRLTVGVYLDDLIGICYNALRNYR